MDHTPTSIERATDRLAKVIHQVGLQVTTQTVTQKEVSFLCREVDRTLWMRVMSYFLRHEKGWKSFVGQKYMTQALETGGRKVVYGWYLAFRCEDLVSALQLIGGLLLKGKLNAQGASVGQGPGVVDFDVTDPRQKVPASKASKAGPSRGPVYDPDEAPYTGGANHGAPKDPNGLGTKGAYLFGRAPTAPARR